MQLIDAALGVEHEKGRPQIKTLSVKKYIGVCLVCKLVPNIRFYISSLHKIVYKIHFT